MYSYLPVLLCLELLIFLRLKCLTLSGTHLTSTLITLYFCVLHVGIIAQGWKTPHNTRIVQIAIIETVIAVSMMYFAAMIQMRQVLIVYGLVVVGWTVVIGTNHDLSVKTFSVCFEVLYITAMFTLKSH
jgi:hypothetical protein